MLNEHIDRLTKMDLRVQKTDEHDFEVSVPRERAAEVLSHLKSFGFKAFMGLTCVDYIDEGEFELVYILESYAEALNSVVKVRIPRENPVMETMMPIWELCQVYERELHEFFGIEFTGNPDLSPFFLDNWLDLPPLRKDFDTLAFSEELFDFEEDETHGIETPKRIE